MSRVTYISDTAKIFFDYGDVEGEISRTNPPLLEWIQRASEGNKEILLNGEEGLDQRVPYLIRDLLLSGKGEVFCKSCDRVIPISELIIDRSSPLSAFPTIDSNNIKEIQRDLGIQGKIRLSGSGGTVFSCGKGHELFGTKDWVI